MMKQRQDAGLHAPLVRDQDTHGHLTGIKIKPAEEGDQ